MAILTVPAQAEYRVYQYMVRSKYQMPQDKNSYVVTSTLDPQSYLAYHGGEQSLDVNLLRTWKCEGHTGLGKQLCTGPSDDLNQPSEDNEN